VAERIGLLLPSRALAVRLKLDRQRDQVCGGVKGYNVAGAGERSLVIGVAQSRFQGPLLSVV
jgi:hypothetical protein